MSEETFDELEARLREEVAETVRPGTWLGDWPRDDIIALLAEIDRLRVRGGPR